MPYAVGDLTESFTLPRARGGDATIEHAGAPATVLVWTCNHCPYALAWHDRIQDVIRDYTPAASPSLRSTAMSGSIRPTPSPRWSAGSTRASSPPTSSGMPSSRCRSGGGARDTRRARARRRWLDRLPRRSGRRPRRPRAERGAPARCARRRAHRTSVTDRRNARGRLQDQVDRRRPAESLCLSARFSVCSAGPAVRPRARSRRGSAACARMPGSRYPSSSCASSRPTMMLGSSVSSDHRRSCRTAPTFFPRRGQRRHSPAGYIDFETAAHHRCRIQRTSSPCSPPERTYPGSRRGRAFVRRHQSTR